ncbi:S1 domain-containing post-transcriptional regulator GSP13 [Gracilibacillus caseinilyticus]|uniref:S1 domain-containing post-transcriptional regulator GSP13 n=1 Tax=Gracilibacillus caseinilyticus TaxID=2932256 RepID=A0ABY4EWU3_9BACI|nr:S1 domain-containing post-transcriptional regulator GSP13 [Gracilibacillus caseinilyticus]UOQ48104.1 S1 domain-containing post-transcriptional regulator GSP13 [Gracilibacillus caseinilyticus]
MSDHFQVGDIVEGVVSGVQPYGAFVSIGENMQGLVHISEVTNGFVKNISDHIKEGDKVKVKIIDVDEQDNKYALSIRALESDQKTERQQSTISDKEGEHGFNTLKDKLKEWIKQSE